MIAYFLDLSSFFNPAVEMDRVTSSSITSFPENVQQIFCQRVSQLAAVLVASSVSLDGIKYSADMMVSVGSCSGLPKFKEIKKIVAINSEILLVCKEMTAWYYEHFRSFKLCDSTNCSLSVVQPIEPNDVFPLPAYRFGDNLIVTQTLYPVVNSKKCGKCSHS